MSISMEIKKKIIKIDKLHLFLLSDGTWIDDYEYLESLENGTELIVCTEEQIRIVDKWNRFWMEKILKP